MNTCVAQAIKTSAENRHLTISLERIVLEVSNTDKELKWLRSSVGSSEKEYEQTQQKISELRALLEHERLGFCCKLIMQCRWLSCHLLVTFTFFQEWEAAAWRTIWRGEKWSYGADLWDWRDYYPETSGWNKGMQGYSEVWCLLWPA